MGQFNSSVKINADAVVSCEITEKPKDSYTTVTHTIQTFLIGADDGDAAPSNEDPGNSADANPGSSDGTNPNNSADAGPDAPAAGNDRNAATNAAPDTSDDESESDDDDSSDESSEDDEMLQRAIEISKEDVNDHTELRKLNVAITNGDVEDDDALQMAIVLSNLEAGETPN